MIWPNNSPALELVTGEPAETPDYTTECRVGYPHGAPVESPTATQDLHCILNGSAPHSRARVAEVVGQSRGVTVEFDEAKVDRLEP